MWQSQRRKRRPRGEKRKRNPLQPLERGWLRKEKPKVEILPQAVRGGVMTRVNQKVMIVMTSPWKVQTGLIVERVAGLHESGTEANVTRMMIQGSRPEDEKRRQGSLERKRRRRGKGPRSRDGRKRLSLGRRKRKTAALLVSREQRSVLKVDRKIPLTAVLLSRIFTKPPGRSHSS